MKQLIYINLYRAGKYHRQGKPNTTNLHGGDVYASMREAMENAEPDRGYITTVSAELELADGVTLFVNPATSVPTPLSVTQRGLDLLPWTKDTAAPSIETSERDTSLSYAEWQASHKAGFYKPTHGGYPDNPVDAKARGLARA